MVPNEPGLAVFSARWSRHADRISTMNTRAVQAASWLLDFSVSHYRIKKGSVMDMHQFYKEHYFYEAGRRHQLTNALAIPIGILTLIAGALTAMFNHIALPITYVKIAILICLTIDAVLLTIAAYWLIRSYYDYSYGYIATSQELKEYFEKLTVLHAGNTTLSEQKLEEYINSQYAEHTHRNVNNNDRKAYCIHMANGFLIAAVCFVFLSSIPYLLNSISGPEAVMKVNVVNLLKAKEHAMPEDEDTEAPKDETPQEPPKEPTPPPGRVIKESEDPDIKAK